MEGWRDGGMEGWMDGEHPAEKDWGMLVGDRRDISRPRALAAPKAKHLLGCVPTIGASGAREGMLPLCSPLLTPPAALRPARGSPAQDSAWRRSEGG